MFKHKCVYCNEPFESEDNIDYYCCEACVIDDGQYDKTEKEE